MAPFEVLYGWRYRSPIGWFKPCEAKFYGTDLVKDVLDKVKLIQERLRTTQSRQKSYADQKARDVSFMVGEKLDESLGYEEDPVAIVDRQDFQLRSKRISAVRVQYRGQPVEEVTWESEEDTRSTYTHLLGTSDSDLNIDAR
ncbi:uncharacterized protein [Nicotiana sylvestris]|uniref:uncharacterized protein n=1 Tax=Nicotiana sylvestris TaxID=4096 RepID=UPI00388C93DC